MSGLETIRSHLCSPSINMLTERKTSVRSIKPTHAYVDLCVKPPGFVRKIRASSKYMCHFMRPRIKACISSTPSVLSVYSVVNDNSCGFVSICGSKGL